MVCIEIIQHQNPEDIEEILNMMSRNLYRLKTLVDAFHDFSTIQADLFEIHPSKVIIEVFISNLKDHLQLLFPERRILLNENLKKSEKIYFFDIDRIHQVVENLVSNAIKNSSPESLINIYISSDENFLKISVEDNGVGISNENLLRLFQPFSHMPTAFSQRGTGSGLYIARYIISSHNGLIEVETRENVGSIFTLRLPRVSLQK
jgi:two-component system sensor histidine kinase ResE